MCMFNSDVSYNVFSPFTFVLPVVIHFGLLHSKLKLKCSLDSLKSCEELEVIWNYYLGFHFLKVVVIVISIAETTEHTGVHSEEGTSLSCLNTILKEFDEHVLFLWASRIHL